MAGAVAAFIVLALAGLFFGGIRYVIYIITGALKPLEPMREADHQAARLPVTMAPHAGASTSLPDMFESQRGQSCPQHGEPFTRIISFTRMRAAHWTEIGGHGVSESGRCYVLGCDGCLEEARRWRAFEWSRRNQSQHPDWASAALYPWLVKTYYFELSNTLSLPYGGAPQPEPWVPAALQIGGALRSPMDELIAICSDVSALPQLSADAIRDVVRAMNKARPKDPVITTEGIYAVKRGSGSFVMDERGCYFVAGARERLHYRAWTEAAEITLSEKGGDVVVDGQRIGNPFLVSEKRRKYAAALCRVLLVMRDQVSHPEAKAAW